MSLFRVWAPAALRVDLRLDPGSAVHPMHPEAGGWWSVDVADADRAAYRYSIDGGDPVPDPRSPWQPEGVHGASRRVDHASFAWTDAGWQAPPLASAVIYELHIGTFTPEGTFDAAVERLDYLVQLGITHVELMPVNEIPGRRGWGYDGVDLYAPYHVYGGPDGLKRFVDACHAKGLAVLADVVYNHLGPEGNYLSRFGPYFTDRYSTPWGAAVNLDGAGSYEVRRFFCDNALMWLRDYHADGLRLDAIHAIYDFSAIHFLEQLASEVQALAAHLGRRLVLIAESDLNDPRVVTPQAAGGLGIDAQWSDDFHHALHAVLTGEKLGYYGDFGTLADLAKALKQAFVYDGRFSKFRDRLHGRRPEKLSGARFLGYIQTHDQVGNRARGERLGHLVSAGYVKIAAALVLCSPFVPMLFQGEEFAAATPFQFFADHQDEGLSQAVTEGRRKDCASQGWDPKEVPDPEAEATFACSRLDWNELEQEPHRSVLEWHRQLIALRRRCAALTDARLEGIDVRFDEEAQWLLLRRGGIVAACNFSKQPRELPAAVCNVLLSSSPRSRIEGGVTCLDPESVLIGEANGL